MSNPILYKKGNERKVIDRLWTEKQALETRVAELEADKKLLASTLKGCREKYRELEAERDRLEKTKDSLAESLNKVALDRDRLAGAGDSLRNTAFGAHLALNQHGVSVPSLGAAIERWERARAAGRGEGGEPTPPA